MREKLAAHKSTKKAKTVKTDGPDLKGLDAVYLAKYPHYVKGSIHKTEGTTKLRASIKCVVDGKKREVFTSDLFQVKKCTDCLTKERNAKRAKTDGKKKAKPAAKKAAPKAKK